MEVFYINYQNDQAAIIMHSLTVKDKMTETKKNEARPPAQQLHIFQTASHHVSQQQSGVDHQAVRGRLPVAHGTWNMGATMSAEYSYRITPKSFAEIQNTNILKVSLFIKMLTLILNKVLIYLKNINPSPNTATPFVDDTWVSYSN